jgi:hypothetical protein
VFSAAQQPGSQSKWPSPNSNQTCATWRPAYSRISRPSIWLASFPSVPPTAGASLVMPAMRRSE